MKARMTLIAATAALFLGGCAHCDCDKEKDKDGRYGQHDRGGDGAYGDNADGDNGTGGQTGNTGGSSTNGGNGGSRSSSGQNGSGGYMDKNTSGSERTIVEGSGGVGNANTERGVNTFDNDGAPTGTTTSQPARKPGTTGSYRTRASGTGTQSGRQVN